MWYQNIHCTSILLIDLINECCGFSTCSVHHIRTCTTDNITMTSENEDSIKMLHHDDKKNIHIVASLRSAIFHFIDLTKLDAFKNLKNIIFTRRENIYIFFYALYNYLYLSKWKTWVDTLFMVLYFIYILTKGFHFAFAATSAGILPRQH